MTDLLVRPCVPTDVTYVMSLMRANRESVGGLPRPAVEERLARGTVLLAMLDGDPVGYVLFDIRGGVLRIPQACIQYDARRRRYGEALIARLLSMYAHVDEVVLRCAADLEANVFWRDMGFVCVGTVPGGRRRGRQINLWTMWLVPKLVSLSEMIRTPAAELRVDAMYDESDYLREQPQGFGPVSTLPKLAWANARAKSEQKVLGLGDDHAA